MKERRRDEDRLAGERHEGPAIQAFITPSKRDRFEELLPKPKKRREALHPLTDSRILYARLVVEIPSSRHDPAAIEQLLIERGAPRTCYVIAYMSPLDGTVMDLHEALEEFIGSSSGVLLSCIPGQLAYYEGESPGDRCILERKGRA